MLQVEAQKIEYLPFGNLEFLNELLSFEDEPLLLHYRDKFGNDFLSYWIDFDDLNNRWLLTKVTKQELFSYLSRGKSLKQLFSELKSDCVYLVDYDFDNNISLIQFTYTYQLTEKYYPKDNSFYVFPIPDFYYKYLSVDYYQYKLQQKSFKFNLKPSNQLHESYVGAREIGWFLMNIIKSFQAYVEITAYEALRDIVQDIKRLNKQINTYKNAFSPVASGALIGSFEIWLTIDTSILDTYGKDETKWRDELIDNFRKDVLDVDYYSKESAKQIETRFKDKDIRKRIYEPFIKVLENEDLKLTVTNYKQSFRRDFGTNRIRQEFRDVILPPKTLQELQAEKEKQKHLYKMVFELEDGLDVKNVKARKIFQNNLFIAEEEAETTYPIESPIRNGDTIIEFKEPIKCKLIIKSDNTYHLSNVYLGLNAEGKPFESVKNEIIKQVAELLLELQANPDRVDSRFNELAKYFDQKKLN